MLLPLTVATMLVAAGPGRAAGPPAGHAGDGVFGDDALSDADRGAALMDRLRRRDPEAALKQYSGRWRKAGSAASGAAADDAAVPRLTPHAPARLQDDTPAVPVFRRLQDDAPADVEDAAQDAATPDAPAADPTPAPAPLRDGLNLDDLGLPEGGPNLDGLGLPDDLRADEARPDDEPRRARGADVLTRQVPELKGIGAILPFGDYDPDPDPDDPCRYLCPRPAGCPPAEGEEAALCPEVTPLSTEPYAPRPVLPVQYRWAASNITYNPLYFQDVSLERYGHNHGLLQPVVSVAKFGGQVIGLPYQMALDPPCKCETPLGYYRPGDCAPKLCYQIPLNAKAALVQAAAVTGVALILP